MAEEKISEAEFEPTVRDAVHRMLIGQKDISKLNAFVTLERSGTWFSATAENHHGFLPYQHGVVLQAIRQSNHLSIYVVYKNRCWAYGLPYSSLNDKTIRLKKFEL